METPIKVAFKYTSDVCTANQYLHEISQFPTIAWDLETASKYSDKEREIFKEQLAQELPKSTKTDLTAKLGATGLSHPYHVKVTHCSIAVSNSTSYVFIFDNKKIFDRVFTYLVNSPQQQILHNASFDFTYLYYHTGKFPVFYEDTQVFAKTLVNHVEITQATVGLKELAGKWYGSWAISSDNFNLDNLHDPQLIQYAATDACATFKLWEELNNYCDNYPTKT